ncbi:MAG: type I restriction enzyme HsdR N-terminal domain-containing protein [Crocinitomicaceae bacterium]|nr:type I restriction enzyme HsdR N-terminal domain-containing protein [Crocinitomicaceae bacterium]MDG1777115.1 type I restriction enzyme HsdR N-terminal domain-containing protein [Crocinitomicaceae bacterium]
MITPLTLPKANLRLQKIKGVVHVRCIVRKKDLVCTSEEWVRQHFIHYLINDRKIPLGLIASEYPLTYNGRVKRADIVVFNKHQIPVLIVECKAPKITLNEETLFQIAQYNFDLDVDYLCLTNGIDHVYSEINRENGNLRYLTEIPMGITD